MTKVLLICAVVAALVTGCEALPTAGDECPAGLVVQIDVCPGTAGRLATCLARWPEQPEGVPPGGMPVTWCVATADDSSAYECVPTCP